MEQAKSTGFEDQKGQFLQVIHTNIRQLTDYMRNELGLPSSYDEEILGREIAKVISYMAFNIDPMQVDVSADATINQFLRDSKNLTDISKYKNFRFYNLLKDNLAAVAACFGIYYITRVESIKGFSFKLPSWLRKAAGVTPYTDAAAGAIESLDDVLNYVNETFGVGDNGKDIPGGIYWVWKYFKGNPYFGYAAPIKEGCSVGYFKGTWKKVIEDASGVSFDTETAYFLKYYPYIKSGYFATGAEFNAQIRKDEADKAAGKTVKTPASLGGETPAGIKGFFSRLFGR
jgi:hypothetical protein